MRRKKYGRKVFGRVALPLKIQDREELEYQIHSQVVGLPVTAMHLVPASPITDNHPSRRDCVVQVPRAKAYVWMQSTAPPRLAPHHVRCLRHPRQSAAGYAFYSICRDLDPHFINSLPGLVEGWLNSVLVYPSSRSILDQTASPASPASHRLMPPPVTYHPLLHHGGSQTRSIAYQHRREWGPVRVGSNFHPDEPCNCIVKAHDAFRNIISALDGVSTLCNTQIGTQEALCAMPMPEIAHWHKGLVGPTALLRVGP